MCGKLDALAAYLDRLSDRPPLEELAAVLARLDLDRADLKPWVRFSHHGYRRNLVRGGEFYQLWVLCWRNGQRSPIHDHAGSACGVRILQGTATETRFQRGPDGLLRPVDLEDYAAGQVVVSADADTHQISNVQPGDADLVTLHVYSPPLLHMHTFALPEPMSRYTQLSSA